MLGTRVRYRHGRRWEAGIVSAQVPQYGETWVRVDGAPRYSNPYLRSSGLALVPDPQPPETGEDG